MPTTTYDHAADGGQECVTLKFEGKDPYGQPTKCSETRNALKPLTIAQWRARDIKPVDWRLGHLFSTSTRALLSAETGAGKTMLSLAWAYAMALGEGFMHWAGSGKPTRVLYVDAEMPHEDLIDRHALAQAWFGGRDPGANLTVLSTLDYEEPLHLDTPVGQAWFVHALFECEPEFIVFDNIAHLTEGNMKETDAEASLRDFRRDLTSWGHGQLWVHHTGWNSSRAYGDSSRLWSLDTSLVMLKEDADHMKFTLKCDKARRRSEKTRESYRDVTLELAADPTAPWNDPRDNWREVGAAGIDTRTLVRRMACGEKLGDIVKNGKHRTKLVAEAAEAGWLEKGDGKTAPWRVTALGFASAAVDEVAEARGKRQHSQAS